MKSNKSQIIILSIHYFKSTFCKQGYLFDVNPLHAPLVPMFISHIHKTGSKTRQELRQSKLCKEHEENQV